MLLGFMHAVAYWTYNCEMLLNSSNKLFFDVDDVEKALRKLKIL